MKSIFKIGPYIVLLAFWLSFGQADAQSQGQDIGHDWPGVDVKSAGKVKQVGFESKPVSDLAGDSVSRSHTLGLADEDDFEDMLEESESSTGFMNDLQSKFGDIDISKMLGALALVLGGYFAFVWIVRRLNPGATQGLPQEVVEVLGSTHFGPKKQLQIVRLGSKLLLLVNSPDGTQSIGEITDPNEVEYLASLCGGKNAGSSAIAVRKASASATTAANAAAAATVTANNNPTSVNLKQILQQLQNASGAVQNGAIFEA